MAGVESKTMATLREDFINFLALRLEGEGESGEETEIREKLSNLPDEKHELINHLCDVIQNQAYRLGFVDGLRILAGF